MNKINCLNPIASVGLDLFTDNYEMTDDFAAATGVLVRSAKMHDMELSDNLLAVARAGAGVNNIPLDKCAKKGIVVFNTPGANANAVKELVLSGMLLASRDVIGGIQWCLDNKEDETIATIAEKAKSKFAGCELMGKKLGVIGLGAIGVKIANAAVALGMEVYGYDPYLSVNAAWSISREIKHAKTLEEIYAECDYITIHVPLLDSTKGMINKESIAMMKDGVVVLNYARDILVNEPDMIEALESGKVKRYVTDFPNTTVVGKKGVILTPHLGASTAEAEDNCAVMAVNEMMNFIENGNIVNSVNYPALDMGVCNKESRISICHMNVPAVISQITNTFGEVGVNISDMVNKSKGDYAYTMLDLDHKPSDDAVARLAAIDGVIKVRVIK